MDISDMKKATRNDVQAGQAEMFETPSLILESGDSQAMPANDHSATITQIEADALLPGQECPFKDGCRGKVHIFNTVNRTVVDPVTNKARVETHQQLKCNKCNTPATGSRIASGGYARTGKFFNRITGRTEQT